ncbi:MAG: hypothetical protein ACO1TE_04935 [Prosthecobacter sp.]
MNPAVSPFTSLHDHPRIRVVGSFEELVAARFDGNDGVNALCWQRTLEGDFGEIVEKLGVGRGITSLEEARLRALELTEAGRVAREVVLQDLERLRAHDLLPSLDCVNGYENEIESELLRTDVQSWHVDSATVEADTYLCTYSGADSEGLCNEDARRRVDVPELRAELLRLHGGEDDAAFLEWLNENYLDLHYTPLPQARPFSFGVGNLWRIATEWPGSPVPPCIHRAPATVPGQPPRLLLIS